MNIIEIIEKKKHNKPLDNEEISYLVNGFIKDEVKDYQMSAFAMAVWFNGMDTKEISKLTEVMKDSGDVIDLSSIDGIKVDKHSTGGVGDKVSLIVSPIVAALGVPVAKMSGRGLGFTGGTLDKLESIPGYKIERTIDEFISQVKEIGISIIGQSENLVPGDKKLYALRDVTATVDSIPMIASSIMSKKIATGADAILLDVKCGDAAFMKDFESAKELSETMINIGKELNKDVRVEITNMNQPLGIQIGNKNEVLEAIEFLKGNSVHDLKEVINSSATEMLLMAKVANSKEEALNLVNEVIESGKALEKFKEWIKYQEGDIEFALSRDFWKPKYAYEIKSSKSGYVIIDSAVSLGLSSIELGGGRKVKGQEIDFEAGITINKKTNEHVLDGEVVMTLYSSNEITKEAIEYAQKSFSINQTKKEIKIVLDKLM